MSAKHFGRFLFDVQFCTFEAKDKYGMDSTGDILALVLIQFGWACAWVWMFSNLAMWVWIATQQEILRMLGMSGLPI